MWATMVSGCFSSIGSTNETLQAWAESLEVLPFTLLQESAHWVTRIFYKREAGGQKWKTLSRGSQEVEGTTNQGVAIFQSSDSFSGGLQKDCIPEN